MGCRYSHDAVRTLAGAGGECERPTADMSTIGRLQERRQAGAATAERRGGEEVRCSSRPSAASRHGYCLDRQKGTSDSVGAGVRDLMGNGW
jgi:hypothetical protein